MVWYELCSVHRSVYQTIYLSIGTYRSVHAHVNQSYVYTVRTCVHALFCHGQDGVGNETAYPSATATRPWGVLASAARVMIMYSCHSSQKLRSWLYVMACVYIVYIHRVHVYICTYTYRTLRSHREKEVRGLARAPHLCSCHGGDRSNLYLAYASTPLWHRYDYH